MSAKRKNPSSLEILNQTEFYRDLDPITPEHCLIIGAILYDPWAAQYCKVREFVKLDKPLPNHDDYLIGLTYQMQKPLEYPDDDRPFPKIGPINFGKEVRFLSPENVMKFVLVGHDTFSYSEFCKRCSPMF